ncbi:MAG: HAMP domain-containing histidine kinase [Xanthomonadaceae bacterium]|nr:HAMP domain-containing histidine kinase [Xanthomonadaceae bacterium]
MDRIARTEVRSRAGAYGRRMAWVFGLQLLVVATIFVLGIHKEASVVEVIALIALTTVLAWLATGREWRPVRALARMANRWDGQHPDQDVLTLEKMFAETDADVAALARGLHGFAMRIAGYNQRERNFTRDASHELRSPLTVIKMSIDMLGEEQALSDFGKRSVSRIKRAAREMEALVEALLILAREKDNSIEEEHFEVNDVLRLELDFARELLEGLPIQLRLDESARFALEGPPRVFAVLVWQLIRNACQQTEQGQIVVTVMPGVVSVANRTEPVGAGAGGHGVDRHGFELAIAKRISERFGWLLELQTLAGQQNIACIRFPNTLPIGAPASIRSAPVREKT